MVMLYRLLEPPVAKFLQRSADANRAAAGEAVVGIEGEWEIVADQLPHSACLGDVARYVAVKLRARIVEADLDGRRFVLQSGFRYAQDIVQLAIAIAAYRGIERQRGPPRSTQQLIDRLAEQLALDVPHGNIECRQGSGQRTLRSQLHARVQQRIQQHCMVQRILANQGRSKVVLDDAERREASLHR